MERKSKTTKALDAYINRQLIHSTVEDVAKKERLTEEIVESALHRSVNGQVNWSDYTDLNTIGIDEPKVSVAKLRSEKASTTMLSL
ncbi:MAG: hypothetical protein HEEMFOPI_01819 [Holosporales bacterium]